MGKHLRKFPKEGSWRNKKGGYLKFCHGKVRYPDIKRAKEAVKSIRQDGVKNAQGFIRYYYCPDCRGYHLTQKEEQG